LRFTTFPANDELHIGDFGYVSLIVSGVPLLLLLALLLFELLLLLAVELVDVLEELLLVVLLVVLVLLVLFVEMIVIVGVQVSRSVQVVLMTVQLPSSENVCAEKLVAIFW